jgi:uridine monophosphate synthetase
MSEQVSFFSRLERRARDADSLLCVGLDPHPELLSEPSAAAAKAFCLRLIGETAEHVCTFKPNSAFFEVFGAAGWTALGEVIAAIPEEIPVILDAKRGDIASTSQAYAQMAFAGLGASAVTVNPYLGFDSIEPFLEKPEHGVFLLCKTSNPGSNDLQIRRDGEEPLFLHVARLAKDWNTRDNLGLVVGATDPGALASVRDVAPGLWILAPGVGSQGGDLAAALRAGLRADGMGMVIPISRSIVMTKSPAREAARYRDAIREQQRDAGPTVTGSRRSATPDANRALESRPPEGKSQASEFPDGVAPGEEFHASEFPGRVAPEGESHALELEDGVAPEAGTSAMPLSPLLGELADDLLMAGCVKFGEFKLKSGERSPIYFDLRLLAGEPALLSRVADAYLPLLERLRFDRLAAVPYAGLPIGTAVSLQSGFPLVYPRKERKDYGTGTVVEGGFESGEIVVLLDDLASTGGSKFEAIEQLTAAGLKVHDIVVLIDRESGARDTLEQSGFGFYAVFALTELLDLWESRALIAKSHLETTRAFVGAKRH